MDVKSFYLLKSVSHRLTDFYSLRSSSLYIWITVRNHCSVKMREGIAKRLSSSPSPQTSDSQRGPAKTLKSSLEIGPTLQQAISRSKIRPWSLDSKLKNSRRWKLCVLEEGELVREDGQKVVDGES